MADIETRHITKTFGDVVALSDATFQVREHEFVVMLGPSGAGKTTTLRTVAGLERPDQGQVLIGGIDMTLAPPSAHGVAFVFQNYALYPFMSVEQNMAFPLKADKRIKKAEIQRRVRDVAAVLQIEPLLKRKPAQLSGGQQQRVALGRAMVRQAPIMLMDEPLTNLDAKLRALMRAELKHLQRDQGATTLYVTHDQVEAMTMGDRILVLRQGTIQQMGTPAQIYNEPANIFVAGIVGSPHMNLVPVVPGDGSAVTVEAYDTPVRLSGRALRALERAELRELLLGVRPEDVVLADRDVGGMLPATVYAVEPLGDRIIYDIRVGSQILKVKAPPTFRAGIDQSIWYSIDMDRAHLFDVASGLRISPDTGIATAVGGAQPTSAMTSSDGRTGVATEAEA